MKNLCVSKPALARRAVAASKTYDFGQRDSTDAFGYSVQNGRLIEKLSRRNVFFHRHNIVKA